ncbi:MAG: hypothetical protein AB7P76_10980 [Candidatus Melainabacteria bacterium]
MTIVSKRIWDETDIMNLFRDFTEAHYPGHDLGTTLQYLSAMPGVLEGRVEKTGAPPPDHEPEPQDDDSDDSEDGDDDEGGGNDEPAPTPSSVDTRPLEAALGQIGAALKQLVWDNAQPTPYARDVWRMALQPAPQWAGEPAPETPIRSVPDRDTNRSNRVSQAYAQTVQTIQEAYRDQIDASLNHPQTGHMARAIAAVYSPFSGPVTQHDVPPVVMDPVEATSAAFTAGGLAELKGSGASNVAPVTEDADWIQNNLEMAQRPVSMHDLMASEALQRQADLSRMALEARLDNEIAQTELARAQAQEIRWRQYEARRQARAAGEQQVKLPEPSKAKAMPIQPATKTKTIFRPRKLIRYENAYDLNNKLWDHYFQGNGQPVEIDLRGLSFSDSVDPKKLLKGIHPNTIEVITNLNNTPALIQQFFKQHGKDVSVVREPNNTVTTIHFKKPFFDVTTNIPIYEPTFWAFGSLTFDMVDNILFVNHQDRIIELDSTIVSKQYDDKTKKDIFDEFDFNPRDRSLPIEITVRFIDKLSTGTDYKIFSKRNSRSIYRSRFSF